MEHDASYWISYGRQIEREQNQVAAGGVRPHDSVRVFAGMQCVYRLISFTHCNESVHWT
jgi:hypothetical protein